MAEQQLIPARHGTATFVPAGQIIKIINTSGSQVIDTWAFALPKPEPKPSKQQQQKEEEEAKKAASTPQKKTPQKKKGSGGLPSQEDAEKATQEGMKAAEEDAEKQKSGWSSYVPSIGWSSGKKEGEKDEQGDTEQQKDSKTWASYFPSGKGFSSYIPSGANDTVSSFTGMHQRDPNKSYVAQLQDFSKTPVGAAGWSGLAALTGSGYAGSMYAGYQAYNSKAGGQPSMEFLSMSHSRAATLHMRPKVNDTLVSNLREPMLTLVEDASSGVHDTLIAACDPQRYKGLGVEKWEEHGSCAENLVLALKELNERAGLKANKAVGAEVTINSVPAPLNLFMNIPWDDEGDLGFHAPKSKKGDYVRLKAERDVVVVMSACPQDILDINNNKPTDAHFVVEGDEDAKPALQRSSAKKATSAARKPSTASTTAGSTAPKKAAPTKRAVPQKKPAATAAAASSGGDSAPAKPAAARPGAMKKKPVPKPVTEQKKKEVPSTATSTAGGESAANGTATPVEKKKPRKLTPRPKPTAAAAGGDK